MGEAYITDEVIAHIRNLPVSPIVDPGGRWVFLRNARVATTSIAQGGLKKKGIRLEKEEEKWTLVWEHAITPRIDDLFIFTFVRNPWERVCSAFFQCRDKARPPHRIESHWEFRDYVDQVLNVEGPSVNVHFAPQHATFYCNGFRIPGVFVGRFERLEQDWEMVADRIGALPRLPHWNAGNRHKSNYTEYYDDRSRRIVGRIYAKEIDALEYRFGE